ncbi:hypothetical protein [Variovorax sp.]|uniref:hypothetical protein n=1 Tax=unclassified Variovorax TaxID=663243 RepID=UPI0037DA1678
MKDLVEFADLSGQGHNKVLGRMELDPFLRDGECFELIREALSVNQCELTFIATKVAGRLHLFSPDGEGTQADGWYVLRHEVRLMGAFGCHRRGIALAWADTGATLWHDELAREQRSLRARLEAFSSGISAASERHDSELVQHLAAAMIFVAERLGEPGAAP